MPVKGILTLILMSSLRTKQIISDPDPSVGTGLVILMVLDKIVHKLVLVLLLEVLRVRLDDHLLTKVDLTRQITIRILTVVCVVRVLHHRKLITTNC